MKVFVQVLGTDSGDVSPSLLVFFDQHRYLFNVGEGTQRFCLEHKIKLSRISHIFLTQTKWKYLGGLPGMILTVADSTSGVEKIEKT
jgi:ribonuclease Z